MAYGLSNGHVTDDATWPWKVKLVTLIRLERNISKTAEWPWPLFRGPYPIKLTSTIALHLTLNISETVKDRHLFPKDH